MKQLRYLNILFVTLILSAHGDIDRNYSKTDADIDLFYGYASQDRGAKSQHDAVAEWMVEINDCRKKAPNEAIPILGSAVFKLPQKNVFQVPERVQAYDDARNLLISIPGHARFYANKIKREQASVKDVQHLRASRIDYDQNRGRYINGILAHLPSPETVMVLGDFLADDVDLLNEARGFTVKANSGLAAEALIKIGLRNPPQNGNYIDNPRDIAMWRSWWEEIKSGKRTLSFVGQKVEYRFKPDGTWDTIALANPPDDGPKSPNTSGSAIKRPEKKPSSAMHEHTKPADEISRSWIVGAMLALMAGVVWLGVKKLSKSK